MDDLKLRREKYHQSNLKNRAKTRSEVDQTTFDPGDVLMTRDLPNYDKARDTFIVVKQEDDIVTIRKTAEIENI